MLSSCFSCYYGIASHRVSARMLLLPLHMHFNADYAMKYLLQTRSLARAPSLSLSALPGTQHHRRRHTDRSKAEPPQSISPHRLPASRPPRLEPPTSVPTRFPLPVCVCGKKIKVCVLWLHTLNKQCMCVCVCRQESYELTGPRFSYIALVNSLSFFAKKVKTSILIERKKG